MGDVRLTKRIEFSASHRYHNPAWDHARNQAVFGACNLAPGHGHNYLLDVTIAGGVSQETGMVVNLFDLKQHLLEILREFDHKHLNLDTPYFKDRIPTTENIATVLWSVLAARPDIGRLETIRLYEEEDLYAEVNKSMVAAGMATIARRYHFASAHQLHADRLSGEEMERLRGTCGSSHLHGHNYVLTVTVGGMIDQETGMVTDLAMLDRLVRETVLARFDGRSLNDDPVFSRIVTTGEQMARVIWDLLVKSVSSGRLERIGIEEARGSFVEYAGAKP